MEGWEWRVRVEEWEWREWEWRGGSMYSMYVDDTHAHTHMHALTHAFAHTCTHALTHTCMQWCLHTSTYSTAVVLTLCQEVPELSLQLQGVLVGARQLSGEVGGTCTGLSEPLHLTWEGRRGGKRACE